jgi:hypothetical protein
VPDIAPVAAVVGPVVTAKRIGAADLVYLRDLARIRRRREDQVDGARGDRASSAAMLTFEQPPCLHREHARQLSRVALQRRARASACQASESATTSKADPTKAASVKTEAAYIKTFYEDPVGIDVTSLRNDVEWGFNGSEDTFYKWKERSTWYIPSGWGLNSWGDRPYLEKFAAVSNSHADMENNVFCAGFHVWTHYNYKHEVWGGISGVAQWEWHDADAGAPCVELLSHHVQYGFETPW